MSDCRPGVFFVTRADGVLDIWDYFYRQNEVAYSHPFAGEAGLSTIAVHKEGKYVAVGDVNGTVCLLDVCDSLAQMQPNEKQAMNGMFEREQRREKNLELRARDMAKKAKKAQKAAQEQSAAADASANEEMYETLKQVDADFLRMFMGGGGEGEEAPAAESR